MIIKFDLYTVHRVNRGYYYVDERVSFDELTENDVFFHVLELNFITEEINCKKVIKFNFYKCIEVDNWGIMLNDEYETSCLHVFDNLAKLVKYNNPLENQKINNCNIQKISSLFYHNKYILMTNYNQEVKFKITKGNRQHLVHIFKLINQQILNLLEQFKPKYNSLLINI